MKFKTTIQIITEAQDRDEAQEIAGEYLSGNLMSSVEMRCRTSRARDYKKCAGIIATAISVVIIVGLISVFQLKSSQGNVQNSFSFNAIQPPLKTQGLDNKDSQFKKEWQSRQAKQALDLIKR